MSTDRSSDATIAAEPASVAAAPAPVAASRLDIVLANVVFSDNVGDGLHVECFAHGLSTLLPDAQVRFLDLGGRSRANVSPFARQNSLYRRLQPLVPAPLLRRLENLATDRRVARQLRPTWRGILADADVLILGGGSLIGGFRYYYPPRVAGLLAEAAAVPRLRFAVYSVGAEKDLVEPVRSQLRTAFEAKRPALIRVRDVASRSRVASLAPSVPVETCVDTGLLMRWTYPAAVARRARRQPPQPPIVGLGVYHHPVPPARKGTATTADSAWLVPPENAVAYHVDIARQAVAAGFTVWLFSNNVREDKARQQSVHAELDRLGVPHRNVEPPPTASALVDLLAELDVVVAARLHTLIPAFCLRVPLVALGPSAKTRGVLPFLEDYPFTIDGADAAPSTVIRAITVARDTETPAAVAEMEQRAWDDLRDFAAALSRWGRAA